MPTVETLSTAPRLAGSPEPIIYRTFPVPWDVMEGSDLLREACARWPTTTTPPVTDGAAEMFSDYSTICHVVVRPESITENMQSAGLMGVTAGVMLVLGLLVAWRILGFLAGLVRVVFRYYRQAEDNGVKSRKESDAAAVMLWSAQTTASRLRTMEGLRVDGPEVGQTIGQTPADSHGPEVTR